MMQQNSAVAAKAGLWRRALAIFVDGVVVSLILGLLGVALFAPTGGKVRVSDIEGTSTHCGRADVQASEFSLPRDFKVTNAGRCTSQFLGFVYDRYLQVWEVTRFGTASYTRTLQYPIDADGHPSSALYLDYLLLFVLAGYLVLLEWKQGSTVGKALFGLRVRSLSGAPLSLAQAVKRTTVRFIPMLPIMLICLFMAVMRPDVLFASAQYFPGGFFCAYAAGGIISWNFGTAMHRGRLPWHDRWAGTEVVR